MEVNNTKNTIKNTTNILVREEFEQELEQLLNRRIIVQDKLNKLKPQENVEPVIEEGLKYLQNPKELYISLDGKGKVLYQNWLFTDKIFFDFEKGCRTTSINLTYSLFESLKDENDTMVEY